MLVVLPGAAASGVPNYALQTSRVCLNVQDWGMAMADLSTTFMAFRNTCAFNCQAWALSALFAAPHLHCLRYGSGGPAYSSQKRFAHQHSQCSVLHPLPCVLPGLPCNVQSSCWLWLHAYVSFWTAGWLTCIRCALGSCREMTGGCVPSIRGAQLCGSRSLTDLARDNDRRARHSKSNGCFKAGAAQQQATVALHIAEQRLGCCTCHLHHCCSRQEQALSHLQIKAKVSFCESNGTQRSCVAQPSLLRSRIKSGLTCHRIEHAQSRVLSHNHNKDQSMVSQAAWTIA